MRDRIILDVVKIEDFGSYVCSVNNEVNGEERSELFQVDLVERGRFVRTLRSYVLGMSSFMFLSSMAE